jgi:hypothetical protein
LETTFNGRVRNPKGPRTMNELCDDYLEPELDDLPPPLSSRIQHLSRKWMDDEEARPGRPHRRARRRIEDRRALSQDREDELARD